MNHTPIQQIIAAIQRLPKCPLCKEPECDCWAPIVKLTESHAALVAALMAWRDVEKGYNERRIRQTVGRDNHPADKDVLGWLDGVIYNAGSLTERALDAAGRPRPSRTNGRRIRLRTP